MHNVEAILGIFLVQTKQGHECVFEWGNGYEWKNEYVYIYKVNKRHVRVINGVGFNTALEMLCDMRSLPNQWVLI